MMIKRGSKNKVLKMDTAGGMDWQEKRLKKTGLALIPGVDEYEIVK